ncbi:FIST C-terminal domain-containing protein [Myxococcota bacterium]|nr:FIST C-terminal domain-containing protein [Myxococcota bacterium]
MGIAAKSSISQAVRSDDAGRELGRALVSALGAPRAVLVYGSIEHEQPALLAGLAEIVGPTTLVLGCSAQGLMGRGLTLDGGYFAGALGLAGNVTAGAARVDRIADDPRRKGRALADALVAQVARPKVVILHYDPFSHADMTAFLAGLHERVACPIMGGAASQPWGTMVATYQYFEGEVFEHCAVGLALDGELELEFAASHGTEPLGIERVVTRSEGTRLLELDGQRASDAWMELTGAGAADLSQLATLAVGLPNEGQPELGDYRVLAPSFVDAGSGAVMFSSHVAPGTKLALHYRTLDGVLRGVRDSADALAERLRGRQVAAVLGFECGARTGPFLGGDATRGEHLDLQSRLAPDAEWLGMMAWGEILPLRSGPVIVNYTFPIACLVST